MNFKNNIPVVIIHQSYREYCLKNNFMDINITKNNKCFINDKINNKKLQIFIKIVQLNKVSVLNVQRCKT